MGEAVERVLERRRGASGRAVPGCCGRPARCVPCVCRCRPVVRRQRCRPNANKDGAHVGINIFPSLDCGAVMCGLTVMPCLAGACGCSRRGHDAGPSAVMTTPLRSRTVSEVCRGPPMLLAVELAVCLSCCLTSRRVGCRRARRGRECTRQGARQRRRWLVFHLDAGRNWVC